jgi:carbon-monoxide dehydrogenase medium subunit
VNPFDYVAPTTLDDAVRHFSAGRNGRVVRGLAGGTDLIVQLRENRRGCDLLVDLKRVPELVELTLSETEGLTLGAALPCSTIYARRDVARAYPGLIDAVSMIGGIQIQNRATLGGNLCNASPAADGIPPLMVYDATCRVLGANGDRAIPVADFPVGPGKTALEPDELLVSFHLPPPPPRSGARYLRYIPRNEMDIAVAGAAAFLVLEPDGRTIARARVALAAVAPTPIRVTEAERAVTGVELTDEALARAGRHAEDAAQPIADMRGEVWQRRHLAGVLTRRALAGALARAQEGAKAPS